MRWWAWLVVIGCSGEGVRPEFRAMKSSLMAAPPAAKARWEPDARVWLSPRVIKDAVAAGLEARGAMDHTVRVGPLSVQAGFTVDSLRVSSKQANCADCVRVAAALSGDLTTRGLPGAPKGAVSVAAEIDVRVDVSRDGDAMVVRAFPTGLHDAAISLPGGAWRLVPDVEAVITALANDALLEHAPQVEVARFPADELPLVAARVEPAKKGLQLALRTASPTPEPVSGTAEGKGGFALRMSSRSLVGLVGQEAVRQGPVARGIIPVVTDLAFADDAFEAEARLWHPGASGCTGGAGWWQDVRVSGTTALDGEDLALTITEAKAGKASPGAALGDPAVALGMTALPYMQAMLSTAVPAVHGLEVEGKPVRVELTELSGADRDVIVRGRVRVGGG